MARWRRMRQADLESAHALGSAFHVDHPEGPEIAPERQRLAPDWCFVLEENDGVFAGYAIAHPWAGALPPGLDVLLGDLPWPPNTLHVHDVVLTEATRGRGEAGRLLELLTDQATARGLRRMTLIAVGTADRYWARQGFAADSDPARIAFVKASYGADGTPMVRAIATA